MLARSQAAGLIPRGFAYLLDCLLIFGFFVLSQSLILVPLRETFGITDLWFHSGLNTQAYTLLTISLPAYLYFVFSDRSYWQGSLGKRLLKLKVTDSQKPQRIRWSQSFLRSALKLLPWEVAHLSNNLPVPLMYQSEAEFRWGFMLVGLLMFVYMAMVALYPRHQAPHDVVAKTLVLRSGTNANSYPAR